MHHWVARRMSFCLCFSTISLYMREGRDGTNSMEPDEIVQKDMTVVRIRASVTWHRCLLVGYIFKGFPWITTLTTGLM